MTSIFRRLKPYENTKSEKIQKRQETSTQFPSASFEHLDCLDYYIPALFMAMERKLTYMAGKTPNN